MALTLSDESERVLWACDDCWAPAIFGREDVAVIKADGIWAVTESQNPRLAVPGQDFLDILGRIEGASSHLLVIRGEERNAESCGAVLQIADIINGVLIPPGEIGTTCVAGGEALLHRDELLGSRKLGSSYRVDPLGPALQLLVEDLNAPRSVEVPLTPRLNARDSSRDRFDPIWRTASEVVYLSNP